MGNICKGQQKKMEFQHIIPKQDNSFMHTSLRHSHHPDESFAKPIPHFPLLTFQCQSTREQLPDFFEQYKAEEINFKNKQTRFDQKVYELSNGTIYQGQWHKDCIHGKGRFYLFDQSYLECYSIQNMLVGKVRLIRENGDYFEGETNNGVAEGPGIYYNRRQNIKYEGIFKHNFLNGEGSETGPGYYFKGQYINGQKRQGRLVWGQVNGQQSVDQMQKKCEYRGEFLDQKFHGKGVLKNAIGEFSGRFEHGMKKGFGKFVWKNGARFQGIYAKNVKNGEGKMFNPAGQLILQGKWINDKPPSVLQDALK